MKTIILEACTDCVQSAINAQKGGADRIELCSNLVIGGLTPGKALFDLVKKYTDIKTRVLLRPRYGDYCYNQYEFEQLKEEVQMYCEMGADGVVIRMVHWIQSEWQNLSRQQEIKKKRFTVHLMSV